MLYAISCYSHPDCLDTNTLTHSSKFSCAAIVVFIIHIQLLSRTASASPNPLPLQLVTRGAVTPTSSST